MIAVIFEVWPHPEYRGHYLDLAAELRPHLAGIDGFVSVERFESLTEPGKLLSLSIWRDEAALLNWRRLGEHRMAQAMGRNRMFKDYRLRVTEVQRDYGKHERAAGAPGFPRGPWRLSPCWTGTGPCARWARASGCSRDHRT